MSSPLNKNVFYEMKDWRAVSLVGPDALDFLHRMTTVNFKKFPPGSFSDCTLLTATGKLVAYFKIIAQPVGQYIALCPPGFSTTQTSDQFFFETLEKFHFMEKLTITPLGDAFSYFRVAGTATPPDTDHINVYPESLWTKNFWGAQLYDFDLCVLVEKGRSEEFKTKMTKANYKEITNHENLRVYFGEPAVPNELNSTMMPLEAELETAVHENKGCYPGQEVIEKIRAIGQVPRRLMLIRGTGAPPTLPQSLKFVTQDAGVVTSAVTDPTDPSKWVGLGFIKKMYALEVGNAEFTVAANPVEVLTKATVSE